MTVTKVLCASLALVGLGGSAVEEPPYVQFGRRGEQVRFDTICRAEMNRIPPAMTAFWFIVEHGGRTCFTEGRGVLFVPERDGRCPRPTDMDVAKTTRVPYADAAREATRCVPSRPTATSTGVVIFRPNPDRPDADKLFNQFVMDAFALVIYDMLPVAYVEATSRAVCMEASDAQAVALRIRDADIAVPDDLLVTIQTGTCRDLTPGAASYGLEQDEGR